MSGAVAMTMLATLAACTSSGTSALTSKSWQLTAITEKVPAFQGVIPAAEQPKYEVVFHDDGKVSGAADCNQFGGTYKTTGSDGLAITITTATMAFCPEGSFADLFVHGLGRAKSYTAADHLTITLDDQGTMEFVGATASASASDRRERECWRERGASSAASSSVATSAKPSAATTTKPSAAGTQADREADREAHGQSRRRRPRPAIGCAQAERNGRTVSGRGQRAHREDMAADRDHREGPGVPRRDPRRSAGELHHHLRSERHVLGQSGLQHGRRHLYHRRPDDRLRRPVDHCRPEHDRRLSQRFVRGPLSPGSGKRGKLRRGERAAHGHGHRWRHARLQVDVNRAPDHERSQPG